MAPKPFPVSGPSPTPLTVYLARHPETNMMVIANKCGVHYDTIHKAERGTGPPSIVTLFKLEDALGIPVQAWRGTKAVQVRMERRVDPYVYRKKAEEYRKRREARDPEYLRKSREKKRRYEDKRKARRNGIEVPPVPMNALKSRLLGLTMEKAES